MPHSTGSSGPSARDEQRIQAAISRGGIQPSQAAYWRAKAAAGDDIGLLDLTGVGPVAPGTVVAAGPPRGADYRALFGAGKPEEDGPEYRALFGPVSEGRRVADVQAAAARDAVAALSDDELHERMFGPSRSGAAAGPESERSVRDPLAARASGRAGKHARGEPAGKWSTTRRPYPPRS